MGIFDQVTSLLPKSPFKGDLFYALDIGTEWIKVLLIRRTKQKGEVIGVGKVRQRLSDMQGGIVTDIWGVVENCKVALEEADTMANTTADQVVVGIAGELVKGYTTTISLERELPEKRIDLAELQNVVKEIQWKAFDTVREQVRAESGFEGIDVKLVNAAVVGVHIDGYAITNPLGFQGKHMTVGVFNAFAPLVHVGALQTIVEELELRLLTVAAEPYAVARTIENKEAGDFNAIFIDIGGGTTDIALVQKGGLVGTKMFALGGRAFTKRLADSFSLSFEGAETMKIRYSEKQLSTADHKAVQEALQADCAVWMQGVEIILDEFREEQDMLPAKILLCGGSSALPEIAEALKLYPWTKNNYMLRKPDVVLMTPDLVTNVVDTTNTLATQQDITPMGLGNLGLHLAGDEKIFDKIIRTVVGVVGT